MTSKKSTFGMTNEGKELSKWGFAAFCAWLVTQTLYVISSIGAGLFSAWVLTCVWAWFIVVPFGVAPLTILGAIGISFVYNTITDSGKQVKELIFLDEYAQKVAKSEPDGESHHKIMKWMYKWALPWAIPLIMLVMASIWHFGIIPGLLLLGVL